MLAYVARPDGFDIKPMEDPLAVKEIVKRLISLFSYFNNQESYVRIKQDWSCLYFTLSWVDKAAGTARITAGFANGLSIEAVVVFTPAMGFVNFEGDVSFVLREYEQYLERWVEGLGRIAGPFVWTSKSVEAIDCDISFKLDPTNISRLDYARECGSGKALAWDDPKNPVSELGVPRAA